MTRMTTSAAPYAGHTIEFPLLVDLAPSARGRLRRLTARAFAKSAPASMRTPCCPPSSGSRRTPARGHDRGRVDFPCDLRRRIGRLASRCSSRHLREEAPFSRERRRCSRRRPGASLAALRRRRADAFALRAAVRGRCAARCRTADRCVREARPGPDRCDRAPPREQASFSARAIHRPRAPDEPFVDAAGAARRERARPRRGRPRGPARATRSSSSRAAPTSFGDLLLDRARFLRPPGRCPRHGRGACPGCRAADRRARRGTACRPRRARPCRARGDRRP